MKRLLIVALLLALAAPAFADPYSDHIDSINRAQEDYRRRSREAEQHRQLEEIRQRQEAQQRQIDEQQRRLDAQRRQSSGGGIWYGR